MTLGSAIPTSSCNLENFLVSSELPVHDAMIRARSFFRPLAFGLVLTVAQLGIAIGLLAPDGPLSVRYSTLIQADIYWFMNLVELGYQTVRPPTNHSATE